MTLLRCLLLERMRQEHELALLTVERRALLAEVWGVSPKGKPGQRCELGGRLVLCQRNSLSGAQSILQLRVPLPR